MLYTHAQMDIDIDIYRHRYRYRLRYRYVPGAPGVSLSFVDPSGRRSISRTPLSPPVFCSELLSGCGKLLVVYKKLPHLFDPHNNPLRGETWVSFSPFCRWGTIWILMQPQAWRV